MGMFKKLKEFAFPIILTVIPTILIWIPFLVRAKTFWNIPLPQSGMATIVANYDGPLYLVAAKTLYSKTLISANFQFPLPTEYYTAHFPLFPVLIRFFGGVMNYPYAMLFVTLVSSFLAIYFFRKLIADFLPPKEAMFATFIFAIFPARWLVVRSIGSADPLFIASVIASLYYFRNKKYWSAGIWGAIAQLTKSPGILLFAAYLIYTAVPIIKSRIVGPIDRWIHDLNLKKTFPVFLIPFTLILVFVFYGIIQKDFFGYFHSGDNIHLLFPPFQVFNYSAPWVGTYWLEEIIFIYLIAIIGVFRLFQKKEFLYGTFAGIFCLMIFFVSHRDISRYILPAVPFLLIGYSDLIIKKEFKIAVAILIIPIYLYSLAFISQNVMPIANWAPFL